MHFLENEKKWLGLVEVHTALVNTWVGLQQVISGNCLLRYRINLGLVLLLDSLKRIMHKDCG